MTNSELLESYDVMQAAMMEESCIQVDSSDNVVGPISKFIAHRGDGVLHRAFSVLLFNEDNKLLIQKRSNDKITFPGYWANTCCSHPLFIENELDSNSSRGVGNAAIRKLSQELGIDTDKIVVDEFNLMGRFEYTSRSEGGWIENEIDYVIGIHTNVDIKPNINEVSEYKWVSKEDLNDFCNSDVNLIAPWFLAIKELYLDKSWPKNKSDYHIPKSTIDYKGEL
jgi:isopentenyl-diphosphate delta-isomerase